MKNYRQFCEEHNLNPVCSSGVGPGWIPLLENLVVDLKQLGWDGDIQQIKEKFAQLRFYIGKGTDAIHNRIDLAEKESLTVCEECGDPGSLHTLCGRLLKTLCEPCKVVKTNKMNQR